MQGGRLQLAGEVARGKLGAVVEKAVTDFLKHTIPISRTRLAE